MPMDCTSMYCNVKNQNTIRHIHDSVLTLIRRFSIYRQSPNPELLYRLQQVYDPAETETVSGTLLNILLIKPSLPLSSTRSSLYLPSLGNTCPHTTQYKAPIPKTAQPARPCVQYGRLCCWRESLEYNGEDEGESVRGREGRNESQKGRTKVICW